MDNLEKELRDRIAQLENQIAAGLPPGSSLGVVNFSDMARQNWENATDKQRVTVRSRTGAGLSYGGIEYKPDADGLIRNVPAAAILQLESATFWRDNAPFQVKFDVPGRDSEELAG